MLKTGALIGAAFFCALLVMYEFDLGMAVAAVVIAVVFLGVAMVQSRMDRFW